MKQTIVAKLGQNVETLQIPSANEEVVPGVYWGQYTHFFTPAFWKVLSWVQQIDLAPDCYKIGDNLLEEIAACLLGGYGIPSEVGIAAFHRIKETDILQNNHSEDKIYKILSEPLNIGQRKIRYRFARQKAKYLNSALKKYFSGDVPQKDIELRKWLMEINGIGYKTASWITRNWLDSDKVAIIDIHIQRAGLLMNLYSSKQSPAKDYLEMEKKFLDLSNGIQVKPSQLDVLIWQEMRFAGNIALRQIRKTIS